MFSFDVASSPWQLYLYHGVIQHCMIRVLFTEYFIVQDSLLGAHNLFRLVKWLMDIALCGVNILETFHLNCVHVSQRFHSDCCIFSDTYLN